MKFWAYIRVAFRIIWGNKLRSFLTLLGIIMGVFSVTVMYGIGVGLKGYVQKQFAELGSNVLFVWAEMQETGKLTERKRAARPMKQEDVTALRRGAHYIRRVAPVVEMYQAVARFGTRGMKTSVSGVTPEFEYVRNFRVEQGRFIGSDDVALGRRVAVIGADVLEKVFLNRNPLGRHIKVNGVEFQVVGVLRKKGTGRGGGEYGSEDNVVLLPISVVQQKFLGIDYYHYLVIEAESLEKIAGAEDEIRAILRRKRGIPPGEPDTFTIFNTGELIERVYQIIASFNVVFGALAGVALLTGGVGIMNIMLVTVTERTREIGLRMAVGARRRDILVQFLLEACVLTLLGGLVGAFLGWGAIYGIGKIEPFVRAVGKPVFDFGALLLASMVSISVGIIFGFLPAFRASRLDPIVALRSE
ncbi:MAG: ABC transporter permease [bacterium JZ-2024 1]